MTNIRKNLIGLTLAAGLTGFGAMAFGQSVVTPYSPNEAGPSLSPAEEMNFENTMGAGVSCETPYSPNECGPAELPSRGGTVAPDMGGAININGGSLDRLPDTPDSNVIPSDD